MKINRVNIGEMIKNKVAEKGISDAAFAKSINIQRQNIKKTIFSKNSVDTDLLILISEILDFDFFQYYRKDDISNTKDYREVKGVLSVEFGTEKKDQVFRFVFGENNLEISNK
jgi:transcriptional regulator with XRE-family HTH domain